MQHEYQHLMDSIDYNINLAQMFIETARRQIATGSVEQVNQALEKASNCYCEARILFFELVDFERQTAPETMGSTNRLLNCLTRFRTKN